MEMKQLCEMLLKDQVNEVVEVTGDFKNLTGMGLGKKWKQNKSVNIDLFQGICCKTRNGTFLLALARTDYIHKSKRYMGTDAGRFTDAVVASSFLIIFIFSVWTGSKPRGRRY